MEEGSVIDLSTASGILLPRRIIFVKATRFFRPSVLAITPTFSNGDASSVLSSSLGKTTVDGVERCSGCMRARKAADSFNQVEGRVSGAVGRPLANLGHTCFVNVVLQCLAYTPNFPQYLARHAKTCQAIGICLLCVLHKHIQEVFSVGGLVYPRGTVGAIKCVREMFGDGRQHDAHEFLRCWMSVVLESQKDIFNLFEGYWSSKLTCDSCKFCAVTTQSFLDLNLDSSASVESSLRNFCSLEKLIQPFTCRRCGSRTLGTKQIQLNHVPPILCLHLKRFRWTDGNVRKLTKHITFPESLNLQPYLAEDHASQGALEYGLYGVLSHVGPSASSGAYTCFVKDWYNNWYESKDGEAKLRLVGMSAVLQASAYVLFYSTKKTTLPSLPSSTTAACAAATTASSPSAPSSSPLHSLPDNLSLTISAPSLPLPSLPSLPSAKKKIKRVAETSESSAKKKATLPVTATPRDAIRLKVALTAPNVEPWDTNSSSIVQRKQIISSELHTATYEKDEWDAALDVGRLKKVKVKKVFSRASNPFQTQQAVRGHQKQRDKAKQLKALDQN